MGRPKGRGGEEGKRGRGEEEKRREGRMGERENGHDWRKRGACYLAERGACVCQVKSHVAQSAESSQVRRVRSEEPRGAKCRVESSQGEYEVKSHVAKCSLVACSNACKQTAPQIHEVSIVTPTCSFRERHTNGHCSAHCATLCMCAVRAMQLKACRSRSCEPWRPPPHAMGAA
jgi:hypothetical protein